MTNNNDECREAFERWYINKHKYSPIRVGEAYEHGAGKRSWECWQAAWNTRPTPEPVSVSLGDIAHEMTGLCSSTCCHRTGGYGGELMHPECECRQTSKAILDTAGVPYVD